MPRWNNIARFATNGGVSVQSDSAYVTKEYAPEVAGSKRLRGASVDLFGYVLNERVTGEKRMRRCNNKAPVRESPPIVSVSSFAIHLLSIGRSNARCIGSGDGLS